jgi:hypothetical protein
MDLQTRAAEIVDRLTFALVTDEGHERDLVP